MKEFNLQTGKLGEKIAREYLEKRGYKIIDQNYRTKFAEIDLVAKHGQALVFIEVRTKRGEDFGTPEESLNQRKLRKLRFNALGYVAQKGWQGDLRVDAVCLVLKTDNSLQRLDHYENII